MFYLNYPDKKKWPEKHQPADSYKSLSHLLSVCFGKKPYKLLNQMS